MLVHEVLRFRDIQRDALRKRHCSWVMSRTHTKRSSTADRSTPYPSHPTKPLPREALAPIGPAPIPDTEDTRPALEEAEALARAAEDVDTQALCPLCRGRGCVSPEVAATFDEMCRRAKEQT